MNGSIQVFEGVFHDTGGDLGADAHGLPAFLDDNGDQAIASYGLYQVNDDLSAFDEVGAYNGNTDTITYK